MAVVLFRVLVGSRFKSGINFRHGGQGSILYVRHELAGGYKVGTLRIGESVHPQFRVRLQRAARIGDVNPPGNIVVVQLLENSFISELRRTAYRRIHMTQRRSRHQVFAVWLRACHYRGEPTVRGGKTRRHEVVVRQNILIVITHRSHAIVIALWRIASRYVLCLSNIMGRGVHKAIHCGGCRKRINDIPIHMRFVP